MGAWGTGISSNDTYADVYGQFIDLYNEGLSVFDITKKLIAENEEMINLPEDAHDFWYAIANGQWECKELDREVFSKVETIVRTGEDLRIWKELEASPSDLRTREKVLIKFLAKLETEKSKPRRRVKKKYYDSLYKKGDCLIYKMDNGNFGGAFVLKDEQQTVTGTNTIAITTIEKPEKPTVNDFKKAEVYVKRVNEISFTKSGIIQENCVDQPEIAGFFANVSANSIEIEVIGGLPIHKEYNANPNFYASWTALQTTIPFREEYIKINGEAKLKLKVTEWTKKRWF